MEIGQVCVKIAGRDAGKKCVVVDVLGRHLVLIDGETRRRKCNVAHLEPLGESVKISKGASHEAVASALGIKAKVKKEKSVAAKPVKKTVAKKAVKKSE